jgi:hypothetical protein
MAPECGTIHDAGLYATSTGDANANAFSILDSINSS